MIALAKSCNGGGGLFNYIMNESKGYELFRNNICGINTMEILEEFRIIQDLNQRATNKTLSLVLSPDIEDGNRMSDEELISLTKEFLSDLGIDIQHQQFLAFVHNKKHKHIHIICNRVKVTGKLTSDHHIGKQSQWIAHRIAQKRGLISAKQIMIDKIKANQNPEFKNPKSSTKSEIYNKHLKAIESHLNSLDEYINAMKSMGVIVKPTINKQGLTQGFRMIDVSTNENYKASEINRKMNLNEIGKNKLSSKNQETKKNVKKHGR